MPNNQKKLLQEIEDNFWNTFNKAQPHELDEHIPIYNSQITPIGYFNIRCYEDLRKMIQIASCKYPYNCQWPKCKCGVKSTTESQ